MFSICCTQAAQAVQAFAGQTNEIPSAEETFPVLDAEHAPTRFEWVAMKRREYALNTRIGDACFWIIIQRKFGNL